MFPSEKQETRKPRKPRKPEKQKNRISTCRSRAYYVSAGQKVNVFTLLYFYSMRVVDWSFGHIIGSLTLSHTVTRKVTKTRVGNIAKLSSTWDKILPHKKIITYNNGALIYQQLT